MKIECVHWELKAEQSVVDDSDSDSPGDPSDSKRLSIERLAAKLAISQYENMSSHEYF